MLRNLGLPRMHPNRIPDFSRTSSKRQTTTMLRFEPKRGMRQGPGFDASVVIERRIGSMRTMVV